MKLIIAIDGHSSCGKSTLAKAIAEKMNITYVDSGAYYRAITNYVLENQVPIDDEEKILKSLENTSIHILNSNKEFRVFVNDEDVTENIRSMKVSQNVSKISSFSGVRIFVVSKLREIGKEKSLVMDGRDIGTKVFPHAHVKFFMTADPEVRALRRHKELLPKYPNLTLQEVIDNVNYRDNLDSNRHDSPLTMAENSILLDNTETNIDDQLMIAITHIENNSHYYQLFKNKDI